LVWAKVNTPKTTAIQISHKISWERTAQDLAWELTYNPAVNSLTQAAHHQDHQNKQGKPSLEQHQDQERQEDQGRQPPLGLHKVLLSMCPGM